MNAAQHSRLQIRLNMLEVETDLLGPVTNAAIVLHAYTQSAEALVAATDPSHAAIYAPMFFADQWLVQLRAFADAVRAIATDDAFRPAATDTATAFKAIFPGLAAGPPLTFVTVTQGNVLAIRAERAVETPISEEALAKLETITAALVDALPSRAPVRAAS